MINRQLLQPQSIVVIGGSNNEHKPGGAIVRNLIQGGYAGELRIVNPKEDVVQGIKVYHSADELPDTELAILVVAAKFCPSYVETLARDKGVRAFIIISAGFGEETAQGAEWERQIAQSCQQYGAALIGPNCIGLLNCHHHSVFTLPIPTLTPQGADLISGSGATALFILDAAMAKGLPFNSVWSVGNSTQIGIEDVLQYMDENFDPEHDSKVKLLYIENIAHPDRLLRHARSLISKGCRIAAIKSGSSPTGSRAASSHTGAIASSDTAVDALLRKAGIVRCHGRDELTTVGCVLTLPQFRGRNIAIVTHAGGPGVMLTDALSKNGMNVPPLDPALGEKLKAQLFPGSAVNNPIDFLATGTPEQFGICIDYCDQQFTDADAIVVIFGSPGLVPLDDAYEVLHQKMQTCRKPIFPVFPSLEICRREVSEFLAKGHVYFADEVLLANALARVQDTPAPAVAEQPIDIDTKTIRSIIDGVADDGYLPADDVQRLLLSAGITCAEQMVSSSLPVLTAFAERIGYPIVAKVVGPLHKSDVGGVIVGIKDEQALTEAWDKLMQINGAEGIMVQQMASGIELFAGAKYEPRFGHLLLCGLGGIFVEVLKDVAIGLCPLSHDEATAMIKSLRGYRILEGVRGKEGIDIERYADVLCRLSALLQAAPEIREMDLNPLLGTKAAITAVDARIRVTK